MAHCSDCRFWIKQTEWHQRPIWKICLKGNCVKAKTRACFRFKPPIKLKLRQKPKLILRTV